MDEQERRAKLSELSALIGIRGGWSHHTGRRNAIEQRIEQLFQELWPEEGKQDG